MREFISMRPSAVLLLLLAAAPSASADFLYPLDALPRDAPARGDAPCPAVELETYAGAIIPLHKPTKIYIGFEEHLRVFEQVVRDTAIEVYGRAPRRLVHDGTYLCRRVRGIATLLSEHALGNAIDIEAFEFGPAPADASAPPGLRGAFSVSVGRHWDPHAGVHSRFLRLVAERVIASGSFRVVLGPSYPGHEGHFHLDLAPYRLVHVFGFDPAHSSPL
jgi:hypothetical protein